MSTYASYETDRLLLKPTCLEDAEMILELMNTPKWFQFIGDRNMNTLKDAEAYITNKMEPQLKQLGFSNYTLIKKSNGVKIGTCGLYKRDELQGVDIGFALLPQFEKQGFAFEAADKLKQVAFGELGFKELYGITNKDNYASQKLLEKLGLHPTGTIQLNDEEEEILLYKIQK